MPFRASKQPEIPIRKGSVPSQDHGKKQKLENLEVTEWPACCSGTSLRLYSSLSFYSYPAAGPGFVGLKGIHLRGEGGYFREKNSKLQTKFCMKMNICIDWEKIANVKDSKLIFLHSGASVYCEKICVCCLSSQPVVFCYGRPHRPIYNTFPDQPPNISLFYYFL